MTSAFSPVGICIEEWEDQFSVNSSTDIPVMVTNDLADHVSGKLSVKLIQNGQIRSKKEFSIVIPAWEQKRTYFRISFPNEAGEYLLEAALAHEEEKVKSLRKIKIIK